MASLLNFGSFWLCWSPTLDGQAEVTVVRLEHPTIPDSTRTNLKLNHTFIVFKKLLEYQHKMSLMVSVTKPKI